MNRQEQSHCIIKELTLEAMNMIRYIEIVGDTPPFIQTKARARNRRVISPIILFYLRSIYKKIIDFPEFRCFNIFLQN